MYQEYTYNQLRFAVSQFAPDAEILKFIETPEYLIAVADNGMCYVDDCSTIEETFIEFDLLF